MDPQHHVRLASISEQALVEYAQGTGAVAKAAKGRLLKKYEPLMKRVVKEAGTPPNLYEDALQAARLGFLEALTRYDVSRGSSLGTFARLDIKGRVLRAVYVNVRRSVLDELPDLLEDEQSSDTDREFVRLVSFEAGMEKGPMLEQLMLADVERGRAQAEEFEQVEEDVDSSFIQQQVIHFIQSLSARQQDVVFEVFYKNKSQAAAARELGISREAVRRILVRVSERGREELAASVEMLAV